MVMENTMQSAITIQGTHCPSCKSLIEEVSQDIPGVVSANVDFKTGQTVIEYDQRLDWNRLKQEIENLGEYQVIVHTSQDPVAMAEAMRLAVRAGRLAYQSGRIPRKMYATASSPVEGLVGEVRT